MILNSIHIGNLRNIVQAEIDLSPAINVVTGPNGAGKTTLLEAVYLLARARSFRRGDSRSQITRGQQRLALFTKAEDRQGIQHKVGLIREGSQIQIKIDGKAISRLSEVAKMLPVTLMTPQTHRILEEGPEHRRRLLNWGVFHVEHGFKATMSDFSRTLVQRNNALRSGSRDLSVWDAAFVEHAEIVSRQQASYVGRWRRELMTLCRDIPFLQSIEVSFFRGWPNDGNLSELVKERQQKDQDLGYTMIGPQRADILFRLNGVATKQTLSRGQQKILILLVFLAQAKLLEKVVGETPIFLVDDLPSELDENSMELVCRLLDTQKSQTIITSVLPHGLRKIKWNTQPKLFHVEQGAVKES